jgi:hypothetical protein
MKKKPTTISDDEVCKLWLSRIVKNAEHLDGEADEGHDWHSLWTGFVLGLGRRYDMRILTNADIDLGLLFDDVYDDDGDSVDGPGPNYQPIEATVGELAALGVTRVCGGGKKCFEAMRDNGHQGRMVRGVLDKAANAMTGDVHIEVADTIAARLVTISQIYDIGKDSLCPTGDSPWKGFATFGH